MPVYRSPDGKIIEEKSTLIKRTSSSQTPSSKPDTASGGDDIPTRRISGKPVVPPTKETPAVQTNSDDQKTDDAPSSGGLEENTRLFAHRKSKDTSKADPHDDTPDASKAKHSETDASSGAVDPMDDPVVGWLVVVDGAGKGTSLSIGYGTNPIGRGKDQRISINFGDQQISRSEHAIVTYDPRSRGFFIQGGGGRNLTYLGDQVVLSPTSLKAGDLIQMGETYLKFIPFCSQDFDWQD